jgi:hypothetical protein
VGRKCLDQSICRDHALLLRSPDLAEPPALALPARSDDVGLLGDQSIGGEPLARVVLGLWTRHQPRHSALHGLVLSRYTQARELPQRASREDGTAIPRPILVLRHETLADETLVKRIIVRVSAIQ